jgi:hypothetical protein
MGTSLLVISVVTNAIFSLGYPLDGPKALITLSKPSIDDTPSCISDNYVGSYGRPLHHVYLPPTACLENQDVFSSLDSGTIVPFTPGDSKVLVALQEAGVDPKISGEMSFTRSFDELLLNKDNLSGAILQGFGEQKPMEGPSSTSGHWFTLLHRTSSWALVEVSSETLPYLDTLLPRFIIPIILPNAPIPYTSIPKESIRRIQKILDNLQFRAPLSAILYSLSDEQMVKDIRYLTGEDGKGPQSRHSFTRGALQAADWIEGQMQATGAECEQRHFRIGFAPNVICRYAGSEDTASRVILSAHYDSRGSFGSLRAPGGDDDGSGIIHLLSIARAIASNGIVFKTNVELVAFAGEEQGLVGSAAYARQLREEDADVTLMIQADMLAYHSLAEPAQLGLPDLIGLPEAAYLVANVSKIYSPELTVGYTPACCSDHQSFHGQGFPATQVFERAGPIIDPMYHNSGDLSNRDGYDLGQVYSIAKVTFATILEAAGFDLGTTL